MPWKRAKALPPPDNALFDACFRIQREACEASGHFIPLVVENVCGAQKWVGRAKWHYGSFYLWGDVPALMPMTNRAKVGGARLRDEIKNTGGSWFDIAHNTTSGTGRNPDWRNDPRDHGVKHHGSDPVWFDTGPASHGSQSSSRKAASARIAKIPFALARHIARAWYPEPV